MFQTITPPGKPSPTCQSTARRRGYVLLHAAVLMGTLLLIASLAVDVGRVHLVRTELQSTADAAARAGASALIDHPNDSAAAVQAAIGVAALNRADGKPVTLLASDVEVGNWDEALSPQFLSGRAPLNAVRVVGRRDQSRGTGVSLACAPVLGRDTWDVSAGAIARCDTPASSYNFVGLDRARFGSIGVLAQINGDVVSNGHVDIGNPLGLFVRVNGNAQSYNGSVEHGFLARVTGSTAPLSKKLEFPEVRLPASNDNVRINSYLSGAGDFTTLLGARIPAGTYVVRNLNMLAGIAVDIEGPVTFYVTDSVNIAAGVNLLGAPNTDARNFRVRVLKGGYVNFLANLLTPVYMDLYAPDTPIYIGVGVNHYTGRIIGKRLDIWLPVLGQFTEDPNLGDPVPRGVSLVR